MNTKTKRKIFFIILILIFISWLFILYKYSPSTIVDSIGVENAYLLVFISAFIGGTSILIPMPYYLLVITLGAGGMNPFLLGLSAGLGVMIGDSTTYLLGYTSRTVLPTYLQNVFNRFNRWIARKPPYLMPIILFFYGTIAPFPNDMILIPMGLAHYPYKKVVIPLVLGNIVFNTWLAIFGYYIYL